MKSIILSAEPVVAKKEIGSLKIEIHSIASIERLAMKPFLPNTVLISIGDTDAEMPFLINKPFDMLRLAFDDIMLAEAWEEFGFPKELRDNEELLKECLKANNMSIFSAKQAGLIADFVFKHKDSCEVLICQCHYGQSRSAGCASAITEFLFGNGIEIFADDRYYPNKLVYREVLKALRLREKNSAK